MLPTPESSRASANRASSEIGPESISRELPLRHIKLAQVAARELVIDQSAIRRTPDRKGAFQRRARNISEQWRAIIVSSLVGMTRISTLLFSVLICSLF